MFEVANLATEGSLKMGMSSFEALLERVNKWAPEPQSKPAYMKVSKGQSQAEIAAAAFLILYMVLG